MAIYARGQQAKKPQTDTEQTAAGQQQTGQAVMAQAGTEAPQQGNYSGTGAGSGVEQNQQGQQQTLSNLLAAEDTLYPAAAPPNAIPEPVTTPAPAAEQGGVVGNQGAWVDPSVKKRAGEKERPAEERPAQGRPVTTPAPAPAPVAPKIPTMMGPKAMTLGGALGGPAQVSDRAFSTSEWDYNQGGYQNPYEKRGPNGIPPQEFMPAQRPEQGRQKARDTAQASFGDDAKYYADWALQQLANANQQKQDDSSSGSSATYSGASEGTQAEDDATSAAAAGNTSQNGGYTGSRGNTLQGDGVWDSVAATSSNAQSGGGFDANPMAMVTDPTGYLSGQGQDAGYKAGRVMGAPIAGMADALNEYGGASAKKFYDDFSDLSGLFGTGNDLLGGGYADAANLAAQQGLDANVNRQRDEALRMLEGRAGRGGAIGTGAQTGIYGGAAQAQADGQRKLAQDAFNRDMASRQLGAGMVGDATRMKYGAMEPYGISPGELASILIPAGVDMAGSALEFGGDAFKNSNPLVSFLMNMLQFGGK